MTARVYCLLLFLPILGLAGCGSPIADPGSFIQVFEQTNCEALVPSYCSGLYGFTVDSAGNFAVGPSLDGIIRKGSLTAGESSALNAVAEAYLASIGSPTTCQVQQLVPGLSDIVSITRDNNQTIDVFDQGVLTTGNCVTADSSKAAALTTQVQQLRQKYYPIPFPTS